MSMPIKKETLDLLRRTVVEATMNAAKEDGVTVNAEALAVVSQPGFLFVNAPVSGVEKIDVGAILDGHPVLDETPVMYWYLSRIPAGFYTVVANERRGRVSLRDARGNTVAEGDLHIGVGPSTGGTAARTITGGIDSWDAGLFYVKVCGHVKVCDGTKCVTISGCTSVNF